MDSKMCTICSIEKDINNFYKKFSECIDCNRARGLKRYYEQIKIKYQTNKKYIMKKIEKKYYYRNKTIDVYNLEI